MAIRNLDRSFGFLLHDMSRLMRIEYDRRVRHLGLTRSQWRVIAHLSRNEGCTQTTLADLLEIETPTLGRLLDRLEAAGWIERRPSLEDRRAKCLYLTAKPAPLIDEMFDISAGLQRDALKGMAQADREALIDILLDVKRNLVRMSAGAGPTAVFPPAAHAATGD